MRGISVICTGQISDASDFVAYLQKIVNVDGIAEVVVPLTADGISTPDFSEHFFEFADSLESMIVPVVLSDKMTRPQAINQAVANANYEMVIVLENPVLLDSIDLEKVDQVLAENSRTIVGFSRRILNDSEELPDVDSYFRSVPSNDSAGLAAYAIARRYFLELRGYDENPDMKGILGGDLLARHQRRGGTITTLGKAGGVVYSPTGSLSFATGSTLKAEEAEKLVSAKKSIYRNLIDWSVGPEMRVPLVSVAIATKDRADLVGESISSVLYQSFQDFEIVVVDDGSEDAEGVEEAIRSLGDSRIKLIRNSESRGVSHARNRAAANTNCLLTAVHDDDDIMLPGRLEWGIEALSENVDASYGSWTNFDHYDGSLRTFITRRDFDSDLVAFSGEGPGHSTWTIPTEIIKTIGYNESLTSSVDHYLATRAAAAGVRWGHIGKVAYLRRVHDFQLTSQDTARQKSGHTLSKFGNTFLASDHGISEMKERGKKHTYPAVRGAKQPALEFTGYLPDHLVRRDVIIDGNVNNALAQVGMPTKMVSLLEDRDLETGVCYVEQGLLRDVSFEDMVRLRRSGVTRWRAVGVLDVDNGGDALDSQKIEASSIEESETYLAWEKVTNQAFTRIKSILGMLRRDHRNGHLLIIDHGNDVPELVVPEQFTSALIRRRLLVRGELGVQVCYTVFGFDGVLAAVHVADYATKDGVASKIALYPSVGSTTLISTLEAERERRTLDSSIEDSGLGSN